MAYPGRVPVSIRILVLVNYLILLLSIALLGVGIWLAQRASGNCPSHLHWLIIVIAILIFIVAFIGLVGACRRLAWLLWMYISILSFIVVLLIVFTIIAFMVKERGFSGLINAQVTRKFDPGNYSPWIRKRECQARFLWAFKKDWNTAATASLTVLILLVLVYVVAWYAFINAINRQVFTIVV